MLKYDETGYKPEYKFIVSCIHVLRQDDKSF